MVFHEWYNKAHAALQAHGVSHWKLPLHHRHQESKSPACASVYERGRGSTNTRCCVQGVTPTLAGILPYSGLKFYTYQKLKRMWSNAAQSASSTQAAQRSAAQQNDAPAAGMGASGVAAAVPAQQEAHPPVHLTLVFGACAGLVGQSLTYPLDIVRRRMQVASDVQHGVGAMWRHAREIVAQHGYRGMFRGLSINWIKAAPSTAVGFTVYDYAKHMLKLENHL